MSVQLKKSLLQELARIVGEQWVFSKPRDLLAYSYDATGESYVPGAVVFPSSTRQVSELVKLASREQIPVVARGAGTNISGGTLAKDGGLIIEFSRMNRILKIDIPNQRVVVEPGLTNLSLQNALAPYGYFFAPDPSSQKVATLGGNVAENAGGPHCLKYGVTTNHVLGMEVVLADGEVVELGSSCEDVPGLDLAGLFIGSEGTLGIVTRLTLRITHLPEKVQTSLAIYDSLEDAVQTVSDIIAEGIIPATLEVMDQPTVWAVEQATHAGYPLDAKAVLLMEIDGLADSLPRQQEKIVEICRRNGVREIKVAQNESERNLLWLGRRSAFGALARLTPQLWTQDMAVPRNRLVDILKTIEVVKEKYGIPIYTTAHAGDGNFHPVLPLNLRNPASKELVLKADREILEACIKLGGTITGEHGVGLEKRESMRLMFADRELALMYQVKKVIDPGDILNPGKVFPSDFWQNDA